MPITMIMLLFIISSIVIVLGFVFSYNSLHKIRLRNRRVDYFEEHTVRPLHVPLRAQRYTQLTRQHRWVEFSSSSLSVSRIFKPRIDDPTSWLGISLVLVLLVLLSTLLIRNLLPEAALIGLSSSPSASNSSNSSAKGSLFQGVFKATSILHRVSQLDPAQYNTVQEYNLWSFSACSAAAMAAVLNAYGHHYRVIDILKIEAQLGVITPQRGLLEDVGIERTVASFGFKTIWGHQFSLDDIITIANHGRPVIVSFPPDRYAGGHLLVVTGGSTQDVYLADSSLWNRQLLTHAQFMHWWEGFSAIVTPN